VPSNAIRQRRTDVKPENVRITDAGEVKLMDFGIMHPMGTRATNDVWGTPLYMAPEWRERGIIDGRSDLYSLGVLGYRLLIGTTPAHSEEATRPARAARVMTPALELARLPEVDPALTAIILRLLERDPSDRFASAAELVAALYAASGETLAEEPLAARASYLHLPVVVGRERETQALSARLEAARRHGSRAVLIGAPAGVGKSRLLQELELEARNVDLPFALGQCRAEGLSARAPVEQALRALVPSTPPAILDPLRPVLRRLLPSLAGSATAVSRDASEEKIAVFEALSRWLRALSEATPFLLCVEDLHWADSATLETLNVIIRALHGTKGLVVATFRSDELSRLSLAFQTVDEGLADHVELAPLTEQGLAPLVELALQGFRRGSALAKNLFEATRAIGYHFARSDEPTRAIEPLLRAGARALDNKALLEAFGLLEEAAGLLEDSPGVPDRDERLIAAWGTLIEVGYHSSTPACIRYAQKLFQHWDATVDLARGQADVRRALSAATAAPPEQRAQRLAELFREIAIQEANHPAAIFLKRAEYRILESIALAITGRTTEFAAGLVRTAEEHPPESPYRAAAQVAMGGLVAWSPAPARGGSSGRSGWARTS
jgi:hypothetical protein